MKNVWLTDNFVKKYKQTKLVDGKKVKMEKNIVKVAIHYERNHTKPEISLYDNRTTECYEFFHFDLDRNSEIKQHFDAFIKHLQTHRSHFFFYKSPIDSISEGYFLSSIRIYKYNIAVEFMYRLSFNKKDKNDMFILDSVMTHPEYKSDGYISGIHSGIMQKAYKDIDIELYKALLTEYDKFKQPQPFLNAVEIDIIAVYNTISEGKLVTALPSHEFDCFLQRIKFLSRDITVLLHEKKSVMHYNLFHIDGGKREEDKETGLTKGTLYITIDYQYLNYRSEWHFRK